MTFEEWWREYIGRRGWTEYGKELARAAWDAVTAAERERCARVAEEVFAAGPPVAPPSSVLKHSRAAGAVIAVRIREGVPDAR